MSDRSAFHPDNMRERFHELAKAVAEIEAKSKPLRDKRDAIVNEADKKARELAVQVRAIEAPLYDMKNEMGALARALGGKTGAA